MSCSNDDVETVVHNFEQMMTLLVGEEGIDGMPGPIVYFLLEKEVHSCHEIRKREIEREFVCVFVCVCVCTRMRMCMS